MSRTNKEKMRHELKWFHNKKRQTISGGKVQHNLSSRRNDYLSSSTDYLSLRNDYLSSSNDYLSSSNDYLSFRIDLGMTISHLAMTKSQI